MKVTQQSSFLELLRGLASKVGNRSNYQKYRSCAYESKRQRYAGDIDRSKSLNKGFPRHTGIRLSEGIESNAQVHAQYARNESPPEKVSNRPQRKRPNTKILPAMQK